ncbi:hypothetical protein GCM10010495_54350 [Kitasatospora herbaricolor]|nr:hypothetical protein [Kitasatospora herbaricolor]GGV30906.1 hypothetical protein GCM10010495_54350 [Kitasatospora herbaricolor]
MADEEQGLASGLVNSAFQIGGAIVLAVVTAVITAGSGGGESAQAQLDGYRPALWLVTAVALAGFAVAAAGVLADRRKRSIPVSVADYDYPSAQQAAQAGSEVLTKR